MDEAVVFRIENRIRGLMLDLFEPTVRRATESVDSLNKITHELDLIKVRLNDSEIVQTKTLSKLSYLDEYNRRIMEVSANQSLIETNMHRDKQEMQTQLQILFEKSLTVKEEVNVLDHQRVDMKNDITGLSHNLMNAKYDLEQKVAAFKDEYHDKLVDMEGRVTRTEVGAEMTHKKIKKVDKEMTEVDGKSKIIEKKVEEQERTLKRIEAKVEQNKNDATAQFESARMAGIKLNSEITRVERICRSLDSAIKAAEAQEYKTRLSITQPLYSAFTDIPMLKIIARYDMERLDSTEYSKNPEITKFIAEIKEKATVVLNLDDPPRPPTPSLKKDSKKPKSKHRTIVKQKRKESIDEEVIKQTRYESSERTSLLMQRRKKSIAIDQILPQNPVEFIEISSITPVLTISQPKRDSILKQEVELVPKQSVDATPSYNKGKTSKEIVDTSSLSSSESESSIPYVEPVDYSPIINAVKQELQKEITERVENLTEIQHGHIEDLKKLLETYKKELSYGMNTIKEENAEQFKEYSKTLHDVELLTQQVVYECTSQLTTRKRENNDFSFELKSIQSKIDALNKKHLTSVESIESVSKRLGNLAEYCYLGSVLQQQDDVDRESIALMGYKDTKNPKVHQRFAKPVVALDKQCLSCAGQSSVVLNAFKIACLAYTPSPVALDGEKYTRREIIELQNRCLGVITNRECESVQLEKRQAKTASTTTKNWRPVSVPSPQASPQVDFPDAELPRILRKSIIL